MACAQHTQFTFGKPNDRARQTLVHSAQLSKRGTLGKFKTTYNSSNNSIIVTHGKQISLGTRYYTTILRCSIHGPVICIELAYMRLLAAMYYPAILAQCHVSPFHMLCGVLACRLQKGLLGM